MDSKKPAQRPTGCYLAPGSIVKVRVPPPMVGKGFTVRVGAHSWDLSKKPTIKRLDRVSIVYPIESDEKDQFVQQESIKPVDGIFSIHLDPKCIYSLTTTTGQQKGHYDVPEDKPFPFPYKEDYEGRKIGDLPKYHSDQKGSFEIAQHPTGGQCLIQICPEEGYDWMRIYRRPNVKPHTLVGDVSWVNFTCKVDVFVQGGHVELGGRIQTSYLKRSPRLMVDKTGKWTLLNHQKTLAKGQVQGFDADAWHGLKLRLRDKKVEAFIDGKSVAKIGDKRQSGYVAFASSYDPNLFDNLEVTP